MTLHNVKIFSAVLLLITFGGCSDKTPRPEANCHLGTVQAPYWVCEEHLEGLLTAVGSANGNDTERARTKAITHARSNLAHKIENRVKTKIIRFFDTADNNKSAGLNTLTEQLGTTISHKTLSSAKPIRYWQNQASKTTYVLFGVSQDRLNQTAKEILSSAIKYRDSKK